MAVIKSPPTSTPIFDISCIFLAGMLYAVALKYFVFPSRVILTGTEGIATAIAYYFDKSWLFILLYIVFQSALLVFAWKFVSRTFAFRSFIVVATVVSALTLLPHFQFADPAPQNERILLVIFGGILAGFAKAAALRFRGSTADEDILAAYFAMKYLRPVGSIAIIAGVVSTSFGMALDVLKTHKIEPAVNTLMYTSIYIFASAETLNNFYRKYKMTMIIALTRNIAAIRQTIKEAVPHRTVTIQESTGGFTGEKFQELRIIVTHEEIATVLAAIQNADPRAFYYHHDIEGVSKKYYIKPIG